MKINKNVLFYMSLINKVRDYCCCNIKLTKDAERLFLHDTNFHLKTNKFNSGQLSEWYLEYLLKESNINYIVQPLIKYSVNKRYLKPDFYLPDKNLFIEIKSRTFNTNGTASEKIDHIPRKYSKLQETKEYKNSKILVVFSAGELLQETSLDIINYNTTNLKYIKDFIELSKKHNILDWISIKNIIDYIN